jgi:hypothetical protein
MAGAVVPRDSDLKGRSEILKVASWPISLYMLALVLITVVSVWLARETHRRVIDD